MQRLCLEEEPQREKKSLCQKSMDAKNIISYYRTLKHFLAHIKKTKNVAMEMVACHGIFWCAQIVTDNRTLH